MEKIRKDMIVYAARVGECGWNELESLAKLRLKKPFHLIEEDPLIEEETWVDPILTKNGIEQSKKIAKSLESIIPKIKTIFVSPCRRARETLQIILEELLKSGSFKSPEEFKERIKIYSSPLLLPRVTDISDFPFKEKISRDLLSPKFAEKDFANRIDDLIDWECEFRTNENLWVLDLLKKNLIFDSHNFKARTKLMIERFGGEKEMDFKEFGKSLYSMNERKLEGNNMVKERIEKFKEYLADEFWDLDDGEILIIGHGGFLRRMLKLTKFKNGKVGAYSLRLDLTKVEDETETDFTFVSAKSTRIGDEEFFEIGDLD